MEYMIDEESSHQEVSVALNKIFEVITDNFAERYSNGEISEEDFMSPIPGIKKEIIGKLGDER